MIELSIPPKLEYGMNVEITKSKNIEDMVIQLFRMDGDRVMALVNVDIAYEGKPVAQFKIPPKDHPVAKRYPPGTYDLVTSFKLRDGTRLITVAHYELE